MRLMCARGLLVLMCLVEIGDFDWFNTSLAIMNAFDKIYSQANRAEKRQ